MLFKTNLYFDWKLVGKNCSDGATLAELCRELGFRVVKTPNLSEGLCKSCCRKLRTGYSCYKQIRDVITKESASDEQENLIDANRLVNERFESPRLKRQLPTTVTPERTNSKKNLKEHSDKTPARKSIIYENGLDINDRVLSELNVDDLSDSSTTQHKVVLLDPNNRLYTRTSFTEDTESLRVNVCRGRWDTVANLAFKHADLRLRLLQPLWKRVSQQFEEYCSDSAKSFLREITPSKLVDFSNEALIKVEERCPFWRKGACLGAIRLHGHWITYLSE